MWHYSVGGERFGPVTEAQLRLLAATGRLHPEDMVWRDGMPDWLPASKIPALFNSVPPPLPAKHENAPNDDASPPPPPSCTPAAPVKINYSAFAKLYAAIVGTFVAVMVLTAIIPTEQRNPTPWEGIPVFCVFLAIGVVATPILIGTLKKGDSQVLATFGKFRLYFYEPKSFPGWLGYYFLSPCMAMCFVVAIVAPLMAAHVYGDTLAREEARRGFPPRRDWWS